jgi:alpha-1,6-mannosyltransferase
MHRRRNRAGTILIWQSEPGAVTPGLGLLALLLVPLAALGAQFVTEAALGAYAATALLHGALYAAGVWIVLKRPARARDLLLILAIALILRAIAVTAPAHLTTDGLRYVWDGRIQWAGFNPYLWVPADPVLAHLRDALIYPDINQKETAVTIYPPFAQMLFMLANAISNSLRGIQVVMFACECLTVWALLTWLRADNLPRERVLIYAWHPVPIWEFTSMAHIDSAATALLMLTIVAVVRGRQGLAGGLMAAAVLTKYFPLVLIPALWRRWGWRMPLAFVITALLLYVPYVWGAGTGVFGFLIGHLDNEGYGTGYGFHIVWILRDFGLWAPSGRAYVAVAVLILGALGLWALLSRRADEVRPEHLVILAAAFTLLTSPHYAWYFGWLIPLLVRYVSPSALAFTLIAVIQNYPGNTTWATATAFYTVLFGGFAVMAAFEIIWRHSHRYVARSA